MQRGVSRFGAKAALQRGHRGRALQARRPSRSASHFAPAATRLRMTRASIIRRHRHHHHASSSTSSAAVAVFAAPSHSPFAAARPGRLSQVRRFGDAADHLRVADCRGVAPGGPPGPGPELCRGAGPPPGFADEPVPGDFPGKAQGVPSPGTARRKKHEPKTPDCRSQRAHTLDERRTNRAQRLDDPQLLERGKKTRKTAERPPWRDDPQSERPP